MKTKTQNTNLNSKNELPHFEKFVFGDYSPNQQRKLGNSGLPADQNAQNQPAVAKQKGIAEKDNVVVSGWKVYNNKGKVVEEYEPFFDKGYSYKSSESYTSGLAKMSIKYDAGDRPTETEFPDGSKSLIVYGIPDQLTNPPLASTNKNAFTPSPWQRFTYDQNDLGPLTGGTSASTGAYTPKSEMVDALGRTIKTTEHNSQPTAQNTFEDVVMRYEYDIQGNLKVVKDPYNRNVFTYHYDLQQQALFTNHIDSGISRVVIDALGKPVQGKDAKDAETLSAYDKLQRPVLSWSKNNSSDSLRMTGKSIYGEDAGSAALNRNLLGKLWQQYDESGKVETTDYDFKGNLLVKFQDVISSSVLKSSLDQYKPYLVDWTNSPAILQNQPYRSDNTYDALNRVVKMTLPENVNQQRKEIVPFYNRAGALEKVEYDHDEYVRHIAYNAKGQRLLIAFGNDVMTRYTYDTQTFRLKRQRSEKFSFLKQGSTITYNFQSGTNRQDEGFQYDLIGNILKIIEQRTDCGISGTQDGSNKLQRNFAYDPLYRVKSATGRESDTQHQNDYLYADAPVPGSPNADNVRAYTRNYTYDKLGNIQRMQQVASSNSFAREFNYQANGNILEDIKTGGSTLIQDFEYDSAGNQIKAGDNRHYLWNAANQLLVYKNQAGTSDPTIFAQYSYGGGERVSKMVRTGSASSPIYERTIYIDGIFEYHILENDTATYEKNYVHVMDDKSRIAMVRIGDAFPDDIDEEVTYVLENQISSSVARLKINGSVIDREEYYPFGDSSLRTFSKKRYRFTGKEKDIESGLYYYGARYYCAWTCRFISIDPLAADYPFYTPYNYAGNKPINKRDIDGLQEEGNDGDGEKNNISNSEANDKIPTVKQGDIPKGSKPINQDAALHSVKNTGDLHKEGRLVKVKNPGGGHFYYSTPEGKSEGDVTEEEVKEDGGTEQNIEMADEIENSAHTEEVEGGENEQTTNNNDNHSQADSNAPKNESEAVKRGRIAKDVGSLFSKKVEVIADYEFKDLNKNSKSSKTSVKNSSKLKPGSKTLNRIKNIAKGIGKFLGGLSMLETFISVALDLAKTGKVIWSKVVKLSLETAETLGKISGYLALIVSVGAFIFWKNVWPSMKKRIDDTFKPTQFF